MSKYTRKTPHNPDKPEKRGTWSRRRYIRGQYPTHVPPRPPTISCTGKFGMGVPHSFQIPDPIWDSFLMAASGIGWRHTDLLRWLMATFARDEGILPEPEQVTPQTEEIVALTKFIELERNVALAVSTYDETVRMDALDWVLNAIKTKSYLAARADEDA